MKPYMVNQLLAWTEDGRTDRVLWLAPGGGGLYTIDISLPTALPVYRDASFMEGAEAANAVQVQANDPWARYVDEGLLSPRNKERRDAAWSLIRPLVFSQPAVFTARGRGPAVLRAMAEHKVTKQTVYRLLRRYWQRGLTPNALLPDYDKCGGRGQEKAVSPAKRGRPRLYGDVTGLNVDQSMRKLFRSVVARCFAQNQLLGMAAAHRALVTWHFSSLELDEQTGQQVVVPFDDHPTLAQFRYWFEKDNDVFRIERSRRSPRIYDKDMRALPGSSTAEVFGPGSRYQIDATIADVYLVSRYDRTRIVGRPVLYIVIDVFSRMIVGLYVGFEGPSWVGAMMALANTVSDKVAYCRQFGMEIEPADWPCQALPNVLLGDRGELAGAAVETLIHTLHVHVENAAPYRADWKGIVEQQFRLLPAEFRPYTPGYIQTDYQARGGEDYRLDATLDIDQFTRIVLSCILHHNNVHYYRKYPREADMVADGVKAVPIELWEWGIIRRSGKLHRFPPDFVKMCLLPSDEAKVTASGIRFYGCYYSCSKALEEHWFEKARQKGDWKVRISYEPRCMDEIYIHENLGRGQFLTCALTDKSSEFRGKTLWEIDQIRQENRRVAAGHAPTEFASRLNLTKNVKDVVAEAVAMKADLPPPESNRARTSGIRPNRGAEKSANRTNEAFRFSKEKPADGGKVVQFPGVDEDEDDYSLPEVTESLRNQGREPSDE